MLSRKVAVVVWNHPRRWRAPLPETFLPRKQIYRSIIDFAYDWNHLHDVGIYSFFLLAPSILYIYIYIPPSYPASAFLRFTPCHLSPFIRRSDHHESSAPTALLWFHAINVWCAVSDACNAVLCIFHASPPSSRYLTTCHPPFRYVPLPYPPTVDYPKKFYQVITIIGWNRYKKKERKKRFWFFRRG